MILPLLLALPASGVVSVDLDGTWQLTQPSRHISVAAKVPGVVQTDLMRAGLLPDPYFERNSEKVQWVSDLPWTYTRTFTVNRSFLANRFAILRCEGLDTIASVSVNGHAVAKADNMFRTWEWDVRPYLQPGSNTIRVDFQAYSDFLKANAGRPGQFGKPIQSGGWGYVRKAPFEQGWDFSPKLLTVGIWRGVSLIGWNEGRITDVAVTQDHHTAGQVGLTVKTAVAGTGSAFVTASFHGHAVASGPARDGVANLVVRKPQLWWPNDMGPQNLYDVKVLLKDSAGRVIDTSSRRIGLRTVTWLPKTDKSPLTLMVNGRKFFARGSNWVPPDSLITPTTPSQERRLVQRAVDAHMNLMRLWGGGYYENDSFLDACDEKGLLVWFEFKYADAAYPSFDPIWLANVKAEAEDNVRRVRHHPSLAIFSGNNEVIGFIREKTSESSMTQGEYDLLFHKTLPDVVHDLAPDAAYTPGSPEIGDDHYWDVWHGSAGFDSYRTRHGFMSEFGFQAFPAPLTVSSFTTSVDRESVETPVMLWHQKNWRDGNALIVSSLLRSYLKPKDFDSTLWLGQINQADGILTGVEHWRRDWPHSSASLVWQFDDPWPGVSWSMIDYDGKPKALYYKLAHAYAPVAVSGLVSSGSVLLYGVSDRSVGRQGSLEWREYRADGRVVSSGSAPVSLSSGPSSALLATVPGAGGAFVWARLHIGGEPDSETTILLAKPKEIPLEDPGLMVSVSGPWVTVKCLKPALDVWVEGDASDNFFTLIPGEAKRIKVDGPIGKVRSLFDTYAPGTLPYPLTFAASSGVISATAGLAEILGEGAFVEHGTPDNIGNWGNVADSLRWRVQGASPGVYEVTAVVSIPAAEAGATFEVTTPDGRVVGTVPGTSGWTDYVTVSLGQLRVGSSSFVLELRPLTKPHDHVMNLRSVTLTPVHPG